MNRNFAALKSSEASLELARNYLRRGEELLPSGRISKEDLDQGKNAVKAAIEEDGH